jgi:putative NIF3 family GTP cyclohydrolase 1 type 2
MSTRADGVSRRSFVVTGAATLLLAGRARAQERGLTAGQVVAKIQAGVGVPWRGTTVDTFKAGDPDTVVTGIATTAMATLGVLKQAAAARRNLIITLEPTFYAAADTPGNRADDPVYLAKKAFIDEHRLVIWRFSDHWLDRQPGELTKALADALGWTDGRDARNDRVYRIPPTTLAAVGAHVRARLGISGGMRVVGRADASVQRVFLSPGTTDLAGTVANLRDADLILSGEPREWEAVEYVADTASAGAPKSMIAVGRIISEEPGMRACAAWLRTLLHEVPIEAIAVGDPYWRPTA